MKPFRPAGVRPAPPYGVAVTNLLWLGAKFTLPL
jgi:hypothetical protein